jgi:hypothetical protein
MALVLGRGRRCRSLRRDGGRLRSHRCAINVAKVDGHHVEKTSGSASAKGIRTDLSARIFSGQMVRAPCAQYQVSFVAGSELALTQAGCPPGSDEMPTNSGALWRWHQDGLLSNRTVSAVAFNKVRMALQKVTPGVSWLTFVTSLDQSETGKLKSQLMNHEARSTKAQEAPVQRQQPRDAGWEPKQPHERATQRATHGGKRARHGGRAQYLTYQADHQRRIEPCISSIS